MRKCERCGVTSSGDPGCMNNINSQETICNGCIVSIGVARDEAERIERRKKNKPLYIGVAIVVAVIMFASCSSCVCSSLTSW